MPIVDTTMITPVTDRSFWVTPDWIRSPMTTSRMRSNGCKVASSRRPSTRVNVNTSR
jgi:hypothetical protein